jgi:hypothetical protein
MRSAIRFHEQWLFCCLRKTLVACRDEASVRLDDRGVRCLAERAAIQLTVMGCAGASQGDHTAVTTTRTQRPSGRPTSSRAAEYLWTHRDLTVENVCAMHALVTDDHAMAEVADSQHFLPQHQRGKPREYEDVNLGASAYIPPFRPATGYVANALTQIISTARNLHPVQAALYLMTRIPYLQAFANGNKRTSRLAANAPLLSSGLLQFSFADVDKGDYIRGMAAFYELGSTLVIEQTFVQGYAWSVVRSSNIPASMRTLGFDVAAVASSLSDFITTGRRPTDKRALMFLESSGFEGRGRSMRDDHPRSV